MSEIQPSSGPTATPASAESSRAADAAATRRSTPSRQTERAATEAGRQATDQGTATQNRVREGSARARASQERVGQLQAERAQVRAERQQLRDDLRSQAPTEREPVREDRRAQRQQAGGDRQEARTAQREGRQQERAELRAARQQERAQLRQQRQAEQAQLQQARRTERQQARAERQTARAAEAPDTTQTSGYGQPEPEAPPPQAAPPQEQAQPTPPVANEPAQEEVAPDTSAGVTNSPAAQPPPPPAPEEVAPDASAGVTNSPAAQPPPPPAPEDTATGITITGSVRQTQGVAVETQVAVEDSTVAQERGVAGVRIDDPGEGATFRFEDAGNGLVRATRFEQRDGQEVAVASQTLSITGAGDTTGRGEAPGTLRFDDIGLELELDASYTPGDLRFVEIDSGASEAAQVTAQRPAPQEQTETNEPSLVEVARAEAIERLEARERELEAALSAEESTLLALVERLAEEDVGGSASLLRSGDGDSRDSTLLIMAEALVAQGSPANDRVLQLLG